MNQTIPYDGMELIRLFDKSRSLSERIEQTHDIIFERYPDVVRVSFVIYDHDTDLLKTYIDSTKVGQAFKSYEYKLTNSASLTYLAKTGSVRVIDGIEEKIPAGNEHTRWLLDQKYVSSLTIPVYAVESLIGFLFFDSTKAGSFTKSVQRDLLLFSNFFVMCVTSEITITKLLISTAKSSKSIAQLRDFETGRHLMRMSMYSQSIARHLASAYGLTDEFIHNLYMFAPLHDIGKIGIPDEILLKPGPLDQNERQIMNGHVEKGIQILSEILNSYELRGLPDSEMMINIVKYHHEFLDGSGYPQGAKGDQIPLEGRIIQVADIFDALTSTRPYKKKWSYQQALDELESMVNAGKLDSACVDVIRQNPEEFKAIAEIQD